MSCTGMDLGGFSGCYIEMVVSQKCMSNFLETLSLASPQVQTEMLCVNIILSPKEIRDGLLCPGRFAMGSEALWEICDGSTGVCGEPFVWICVLLICFESRLSFKV